ncbi:MAG: hypothetical protein ACLFWL_13050, partial [Candidatus Brocadiia bacterium]
MQKVPSHRDEPGGKGKSVTRSCACALSAPLPQKSYHRPRVGGAVPLHYQAAPPKKATTYLAWVGPYLMFGARDVLVQRELDSCLFDLSRKT